MGKGVSRFYTGPTRQPLRREWSFESLDGHTDLVQSVIHFPGGKRMITCSVDGSLRVWNSEDGSQIGKAWYDGESPVNTIALSPDEKTVASGSDDGAVRMWDIGKGTMIAKWMGHSDRVLSVCWNRNGQRVVSGSADGTARVWDVKSGETILGPIDTKHETVYTVVYSPDDTMVATGGSGSGGYIKIWDAKRFKLVTILKGHEWTVRCLAWTSAGTLISGSADCSIATWNTTTWEQLTVLRTDSHIIAIAISPNPRIIASASRGFTVDLWDIENNRHIGSPFQHMSAVECVSFSGNGKLLVTGSANNVFPWDVSEIVAANSSNASSPLADAPQDPARKSGLDADTRRPTKPILPPGFFGGTVPFTEPQSAVRQPSSRPRTLGDLFPLFRRSHFASPEGTSHGVPTPFRSPISILVRFFRHHRPDSKQRPPEVDVSHSKRKDKNIHIMQQSNKRSLQNNAITIIIPTTRSSVVQQSSDQVSGQQSSSQLQDSITTTHPHIVTRITSAGTPSTPGAMKWQAAPRSSFGRFLCCNFPEDVNDCN